MVCLEENHFRRNHCHWCAARILQYAFKRKSRFAASHQEPDLHWLCWNDVYRIPAILQRHLLAWVMSAESLPSCNTNEWHLQNLCYPATPLVQILRIPIWLNLNWHHVGCPVLISVSLDWLIIVCLVPYRLIAVTVPLRKQPAVAHPKFLQFLRTSFCLAVTQIHSSRAGLNSKQNYAMLTEFNMKTDEENVEI